MQSPNIYISISNKWRVNLSTVVQSVKDMFNQPDIHYFTGGNYTDKGVRNCDVFVLYCPKNAIIGKGAYTEYVQALNLGKRVYIWYEGKFYYNGNVKTIENAPDWESYARIDLNPAWVLMTNKSKLATEKETVQTVSQKELLILLI